MGKFLIPCSSLILLSACGGSAPSTPTTPSASTPAAGQTFSVDLPIAAGDGATAAFGIWPFGVHGASHAADGHPGFDVEFRVGASVRAAADGTIQNLLPDSGAAGRFTLRISHVVSGRTYATDYTNVGSLASGISAGATVTRGQALGEAGVQTQFIGSSLVTWAMTHFQVNDFTVNDGLTNQNAVSPESRLSESGRALFETLWQSAAYSQELTEPLASGSRHTTFPLTRRWTTTDAGAVAAIEFTRTDPLSPDHTYAIVSAAGVPLESGAVTIRERGSGTLSTVDLVPRSGATRLGVYDILNRTMRLNLGAPGASRPSSLSGAASYTTP